MKRQFIALSYGTAHPCFREQDVKEESFCPVYLPWRIHSGVVSAK